MFNSDKRGLIKNVIGFLILFIFSLPMDCFGAKHYVYIAKKAVGSNSGNEQIGDIVDIRPFTRSGAPSKKVLGRYRVIVADLTDAELTQLKEPDRTLITAENGEDPAVYEYNRYRKRKIDLTKITVDDEKEVTRSAFFNSVSVKSIAIS